MKRIAKIFKRYNRRIICYASILFVLFLFVFLFLDLVKVLITIIGFIALNVFIRFYRRILPGIPIEVEIVIFGGILTTVAFGFWAGLLVVVFASVFGEFFNQTISPWSLVNIGTYVLVPVITWFFKNAILNNPLLVVGYGLTLMVIINLIIFVIFIIMGYDMFKNIAFAITNIFFNWLLFSYLALPLLKLLIN